MVFGKNGNNMVSTGSMDRFSDGNIQMRTGNIIYGNNGLGIRFGNSMMSTPKGIVTRSGDRFYAPDGTYFKSGNTLYCPDGSTYMNIKSDDDIWSIINHG